MIHTTVNYYDFVPQIVPQNMNGKLNYKIWVKKDHVRSDGTSALYLNIYYQKRTKRLPLNISVPVDEFDKKKQRVKKSYKYADDYNLLIEKILSDVTTIEIGYRLSGEIISIEKLIEDLYNPSLRINFIDFASKLLEHQKNNKFIEPSTYRQQKGFIAKLKRWRDPLLFSDIDKEFLLKLKSHLKHDLKNKPATIESTLKNFKKYLHAANDKGINTKLNYKDISIGKMDGEFTFLLPSELSHLIKFYNSPYINGSWKNILQRYLFSCFTGLRISDIERITEDNIIENILIFTQKKTKKLNRIPLNENAKALIELPHVFRGNYTREYINRELKLIAKACNIKKRLYFHSSRHTFATNYLIAGGKVHNLQKRLGHSKIETTMVYVHVVEAISNDEIKLMDELFRTQ